MESIKEILMRRDGMTSEEADDLIADAKDAVNEVISEGGSLDDIEDIVADYFGLEPDYVMELL